MHRKRAIINLMTLIMLTDIVRYADRAAPLMFKR